MRGSVALSTAGERSAVEAIKRVVTVVGYILWIYSFAEIQSSFAEIQGSFAEIQGSFAEIQGSFAEIQGSFAEIQGSFAKMPSYFPEIWFRVSGFGFRV